ncbi:aminopeptidase P family protein [Oharaeibacter diazotrophicus]|uniref:Xaa-Pro aminopeptidase n=3 Tax=Oharaeibacter diazotrophicus TaxID=1920512 RepID=A0A4V3CWA2_9HYPH|nr:aminopeptidase P family protein [Oharaeibacter diazotrophicus]TDP85558.1 Xaa-Pro aminopeptidase [Oharaeibacter diazotrophicus]BBE74529.1 putative peptidase [Pleomorphomonas sp. SM30]GLS75772.1 aminopeptidase [Oharaeibacter diazotrophicus]
MFQTFETVGDPTAGPARLKALRAELSRRGLDGFLVPLADEHQGEYIPDSAKRLQWLTGFAGSAGIAVVLAGEAAIFVDGRYTLQVRTQVDTAAFVPHHLTDEPPHAWLKTRVGAGARVGYDAWLHTAAEVERFEKALAEVGATLVPVEGNPVDAVWADRPEPPLGAVTVYPAALAGEEVADKLARVGRAIAEAGADAAVITQPDSIAWAFNIRGADVAHTPLPLSFAILRADGRPTLFVDGRKLSNAVRDTLAEVADVEAPAALEPALAALGAGGARVLVDRATAAARVAALVAGAGGRIVDGRDPVVLPKARKNAAELAGTRGAHVRDGAAMVRFLAWFDREAPKGGLDEIAAATALEGFRAETGALREISFDTISGAGPNGAIVHYRVTTETNRAIRPGELYLIDSGAQYEDGTTDITRTLAVGEPTAEMRDRFTRVLQGHVRIARAVFPKGTHGGHLDILARQALWEAGLDFDHGTGHGVGVFLSVHEGPQRISRIANVPLEPGMILSNEPGYYRTGAYGIRIENLVVVGEPQTPPGGERPMMAFETITFAPIDRRLIEPALLAPVERAWVDDYHARVRDTLMPHLAEADDRAWLAAATAPL